MDRGIPRSRHFGLQELEDGVYAAIASDEGWAVGNAGIVSLGDSTVIFDTFCSRAAAMDLKVDAEHATGRKVDFVVLSHGHRDHFMGNQVFGEASIVATRKTYESMLQRRERKWPIKSEIEEEFKEWKSNPLTNDVDRSLWESYRQAILEGIETYELKLPDVGFEASMKFYGSKRSAEAITYGGGHSASDALLFLPEERIVFLGDLLFVGYHPAFALGDADELLRILDKVEALDPKVLVPGHGPTGTTKDIQFTRDYVLNLQKIARGIQTSEGAKNQAADIPIATPFDGLKWRAFWAWNLDSLINKESSHA
jgi:glyoxylase-like metal-dependent hydrolase (beta-lactamase superfamily II)